MMAVITINNFPDELYSKLNERAQMNGRVVGDEIIDAAKQLIAGPEVRLNVSQKLALADKLRASTAGAWIDDELIDRARHEGRA
jgi:plasmid stability protein